MVNNHPTGNCEKKELNDAKSNEVSDRMKKWSDFYEKRSCNVVVTEVNADPTKGITIIAAKRGKFEDLSRNYISINLKKGPVKIKKVAKQTAQESEGMEI